MLPDFSILDLTFIGIFLLSWIVQMIYYWGVFSRLAFFKPKPGEEKELPPVSVVICARNEYHNLVNNLPEIFAQDYPNFEVVIVNHASDDETSGYLKEIQIQHKNLKVVNIERDLNFFKGKKFPLSMGIKSASNEILLLTDADCQPAGKNWITSMVQQYYPETEIVLGYGPYEKKSGLLNLFIRFDTFMVALQYLSFALSGKPYMGVGRNLSYKRSMFFKNKGFTSHYKIPSGDDDLFINKVANRKNTRINIEPESYQFSRPKKTFSQWLDQKQRHLSTGKHYKFKFKFLLGLFSLSQILLFASFTVLLVFQIYPWVVLGMFAARFISVAVIHKYAISRLHEGQLFLFSLLAEVFYILFMFLVSVAGMFRKEIKWR